MMHTNVKLNLSAKEMKWLSAEAHKLSYWGREHQLLVTNREPLQW